MRVLRLAAAVIALAAMSTLGAATAQAAPKSGPAPVIQLNGWQW